LRAVSSFKEFRSDYAHGTILPTQFRRERKLNRNRLALQLCGFEKPLLKSGRYCIPPLRVTACDTHVSRFAIFADDGLDGCISYAAN